MNEYEVMQQEIRRLHTICRAKNITIETLLEVCKDILNRWKLEPKNAIFPAHALRGKLEEAIKKVGAV